VVDYRVHNFCANNPSMIPLAHAAHWALYALPVFLLTLGLTVLALVEGRSARRKARREDDDR